MARRTASSPSGAFSSRYSYARAIARAAGARDGTAVFDGLEAEVDQELKRSVPPSYQPHGGIFIPIDLRSADQVWQDRVAKRALDSKTLAKGSELRKVGAGHTVDRARLLLD